MPRQYVDNAMNRGLGRVGMPHGSMPHSSSSSGGSSSGGSSGFYVDNSMNRGLGRVGMSHGSMPHSRSDSGSSSGSLSSFGFGASSIGSTSYNTSRGGETYADNDYNRRVGRAGLPMGSMPISKSSNVCNFDASTSAKSSRSYSSGEDSYADNAFNRRSGRVGMPKGTMIISKSESTTSKSREHDTEVKKTYADNEFNRKVGRVGLPIGTKVITKSPMTSANCPERSRVKSAPANPKATRESSDSSPAIPKTYVDNAYNRRHNRVGLPLGDAILGISDSPKLYVDNPLNQSLDREGKEVGEAVFTRKTNFIRRENYVDNSLNRQLGRVGYPRGSRPVARKSSATKQIPMMMDIMSDVDQEHDQDYRLGDTGIYGLDTMDGRSAYEFAKCQFNRMHEEHAWVESHQTDESPKTTSTVLENYRGVIISFTDLALGSKIGQGGFGEVFYAEWQESIVAVKKFSRQSISKRMLRAFESEVMMLCELDHPTIIKFIGACIECPDICIVMEYMDMSLFEALHVQNSFEFPESVRLSIMCQTCDGLDYLHSKDIAHCDLKTANVLLNYTEGEECQVKITDFGISVMKNYSQTTTSATNSMMQNAGTPRYSAPEVLRGEMLKVEAMMMADIYSLALILFEVIYEEEPYYDLSYLQLQKLVGETGLKPNFPVSPDINRGLKEVMKQALDFSPKHRPTAFKILHTISSRENIYFETAIEQ